MRKLSAKQGAALLQIARSAIAGRLAGDSAISTDNLSQESERSFDEAAGTFITLKMGGQLRGCIGNIEPVCSLRESVCDNAVNAAFHDYRFSPLTAQEYEEVELSLSVLTPAVPLSYLDGEDLKAKLRPAVDGVILRCRGRSATFLPQVWEQLPDCEQFLAHLCLKAGLPQDIWKSGEADILTYQVQSFTEDER